MRIKGDVETVVLTMGCNFLKIQCFTHFNVYYFQWLNNL